MTADIFYVALSNEICRIIIMVILVIDGQGGGIGARLVEALRKSSISAEIIAVGTNSRASDAML